MRWPLFAGVSTFSERVNRCNSLLAYNFVSNATLPEERDQTYDQLVMSQKANALYDRSGSDDSVLRIVRVRFWELNRTNRNLISDRENLHIRGAFFDKRIYAHIDVDFLVLCQPCNFPQADGKQ